MPVDTIIGRGSPINPTVENITLGSGFSLGWGNPADLFLVRDAANILAQRNGTNAQTLRLYETFTDASNNQGLSIDVGITLANTITITPFENGTGSDNIGLTLKSIGSTADIVFDTADRISYAADGFGAINLLIGTSSTASTLLNTFIQSLTRTTDQIAHQFTGTFSPASGTARDRFFTIEPTINWGGTPGAGSYEALFINATETAIPTGTNYIFRGQIDALDIFRVSTRGAVSLGNFTEGGIAAWITRSSRDSVTLTGATTDTTTISVPSGARLLAVLLNVDTTVVNDGDDTWGAAFVTGSTTTVASTGTAAAQNTKITLMLSDEITTAITQIRFTPQGANFTAGVIEVVVYYEELTPMADA